MAACWGVYIERVGWGFGATAIRLILLRATQLRHVQSTPDAAAIEAHGGLSMFLAWKRIGVSWPPAGAGLSKLSLWWGNQRKVNRYWGHEDLYIPIG